MNRVEIFQTNVPAQRRATIADAIVLLSLAVLFYGGLTLATNFANQPTKAEQISLSPGALPLYTLFSVGRMLAAYLLFTLFTLFYGRMAAYNRRAEKIMLPLLDVLQSVPILSFLPVVLISLSAIMPQRLAAELLGFAAVEKGDISLTSLGQTFADASILERKEIFATRIRRLPTFRWMLDILERLISTNSNGMSSSLRWSWSFQPLKLKSRLR